MKPECAYRNISLWICLSMGAALCGCHAKPPESKPVPVVAVTTLQTAPDEQSAQRYSGSVRPETTVPVSFRIGGYVEEIGLSPSGGGRLLAAGDPVTAGMVLARVRLADYQVKVEQAKAGLEASQSTAAGAAAKQGEARAGRSQAAAALEAAKATYAGAGSQIREAQASLGAAESALAEVNANRSIVSAQVREARAGADKTCQDFERAAALYASKSLTRTDYDAAKAAMEAAAARLSAAGDQAQVLNAKERNARAQREVIRAKIAEAHSQQLAAEAGIARARGALAASENQIRQAGAGFSGSQAGIRASGAQVKEASIPLKDATLRAPLSGVVIRRDAEIGALMGPGMPAFVLADNRRVKVVSGVPDLDLNRVRLGQEVEVRTEALNNRVFRGKITSIAAAADAKARVFDVEVTIDNRQGLLKPGMVATIELRSTHTVSLPTIPLTAIVRGPGNAASYAVMLLSEENGQTVVRQRPIQIGEAVGNRISIRGGLQPGERFVAEGASLLQEGQRVQPAQEGAADAAQSR